MTFYGSIDLFCCLKGPTRPLQHVDAQLTVQRLYIGTYLDLERVLHAQHVLSVEDVLNLPSLWLPLGVLSRCWGLKYKCCMLQSNLQAHNAKHVIRTTGEITLHPLIT